jgi:hypothetical protein
MKLTKEEIKEKTRSIRKKGLFSPINQYKHVCEISGKRFECDPAHNNYILVESKDSDICDELGIANNKQEFIDAVYDYVNG